jgi:UDP-N-acetylglucosamine 4,6-dehydratase/UDP-glucose 4-epimerase
MILGKKNKYLITGGAGFLGKELIARLKKMNCKNITVISRNESKLLELKELFPYVNILTGDISDKYIVEQAVQNIDAIFHLAAFKHVTLAETNPKTCLSSNVLGTLNLLDMTLKYPINFILGVSTDKAAQIKGVYGATKFLQERLFTDYENQNSKTKYRTVRYGNVLYSTGSVLCKWKKNLQQGKEIIVTDPSATRFYWSVNEAIDLIFECLKKSKTSTPYVPKMKSMTINDLLEAMIIKYSSNMKRPKIRVIGLQKGENLHELISENMPDSFHSERFTIKEILKII